MNDVILKWESINLLKAVKGLRMAKSGEALSVCVNSSSLFHTHTEVQSWNAWRMLLLFESFMDENMDEVHCNYSPGGYVFSLMTRCLLIKAGNT